MRPIKRVAVLGATGMLGIPVATALAEAGFEVTALVRNPAQARRALPEAIAAIEADVRDEESLRQGLRGQDGLYLSLSVPPSARQGDFHTEAQGLEHILAAARQAKITRLAYLSALVHDTDSTWWVIEVWRRALARIKASGIPYTIFYPTSFMETLAQRHIVGAYFIMLGRSRYPNYWIAGSDFGVQVARSFALPEAAMREYYVQGPEALTYDEAAARYVQSLRKSVRVIHMPLLAARLGGIVSNRLDFDARIMDVVLSYPETFKATDTWEQLGKPTTTIAQFAARQATGRDP